MVKKREDYNGYMREYMLERYHRRRKLATEQLGGKCQECGSSESLEFDHEDRNKKSFTLAKALAGWSEVRLQKELKKCRLLCTGCHRKKTLKELGWQDARNVHGTLSSYKYCRCSLCRAAKAEYTRKYRLRKKKEKLGS